MISFLIIDDEYLVREQIKCCINYEKLGFQLIGESEDGIDALKKIDELRPQLIILDINIPFINGIELSNIIKSKYRDIKILILTGYSEFEFAKKCIKIGISDYLVKPIDSIAFENTLLDIKNEIMNGIKQNDYIKNLENSTMSSETMLKVKFLNTLISDDKLIKEQTEKQLRNFNENMYETAVVVLVIEIDNFQIKWKSSEEKKLWKFATLNVANEIFSKLKASIVFYGPYQHIVCIISTDSDKIDPYKFQIISSCQEIKKKISELLGFSITIGIGTFYSSYNNIHNSYNEALKAASEKYLQGHGRILEYKNNLNASVTKVPIAVISKQDVMILLRIANIETCKEEFSKILQESIRLRLSAETVQMIYSEFALAAFQYTFENKVVVEKDLIYSENYISYIKTLETAAELNDWVIMLYEDVIAAVNTKNKVSQIVVSAKEYIEENYYRPEISLEEIAGRLFVNGSYLSKIFKREMKYSIVEYLTEYRMKMAKDLFDINAGFPINIIANKVGYTDPFYFSKLFKRHFGIPPSKYLEKK